MRPPEFLREHVQLVLTDPSGLSAGQDFGVHALRTWRLGDLGAKHALLLAHLNVADSMPFLTVTVRLSNSRAPR